MKKSSAVVALLLVASQSFFPEGARACTIRISLWENIAEADLIVVARVERIEDDLTTADPTVEPSPERKKVTLRILDIWKGSAESDVVVDFSSGVPDDYDVGDVAIEFLERGESRAGRSHQALIETETYMADALREAEETGEDIEDWTPEDQEEAWKSLEQFSGWSAGRWFPIGFWPDLRGADEEARETMKDLVTEAVRLQAANASDEDRREWSVVAVEHYVTRPYGIWELSSRELTEDQRRRLAEAFVREPAVDRTDLDYLQLFEGYPSLDVDRAAAAVIEAGFLIEPIPGWVTAMVDEALKRYGDSFADRIGRDDRDSRGRLIYTGKGENTLPTIWEVARRDLGIPVVLPAAAPKRLSADRTD